ncbi:MAG: RNA polymerase factor sigma-54 [Xanthomonadales bacterium]|nr:RNA polymerase factor sigma-54 [Xanthomonadales bacterium]
MDQSLQLRLSQKLALAPQLQQAIRLLQLNRIELREYLQEAIESNPLLEQAELDGDTAPEREEAGTDEWDEHALGDSQESEPQDFDSQDAYEDWDEGLGSSWEEAGYQTLPERQLEDASSGGLREHLLFQISLASFNDTDAAIATAVVYALDEEGYLADSLAEIAASLLPEYQVSEAQIEAVLSRLQRMEPVGVASRSPAECIRVQLSVLPGNTAGLELARRIARSYLDFVVAGEQERLQRELGAKPEELALALDLIRGLEPRPGARYDNRADEYLVPDIYVRQQEGKWVTALSPDNDPQLRLNRYYMQLLRQSSAADKKYLDGRLQEARWLLSSLELRNRTLLTVSQRIVDVQRGFMEHGEIAMQPLILKDIAETAGVHESTVSRATTRKYMLTPRGLFELKYFFSSHVGTSDGGTVSATSVKARLNTLIAAEPPGKPLSDLELSRLLQETGIKAARRTVAKYREALGIGSSAERRRAWRRLTQAPR